MLFDVCTLFFDFTPWVSCFLYDQKLRCVKHSHFTYPKYHHPWSKLFKSWKLHRFNEANHAVSWSFSTFAIDSTFKGTHHSRKLLRSVFSERLPNLICHFIYISCPTFLHHLHHLTIYINFIRISPIIYIISTTPFT